MARFSKSVIEAFQAQGLDTEELRRAQRALWVRDLWKRLVEQAILDHTNGVYIFTDKGKTEMHVYMDNSLYASEVSNRKGFIQQDCVRKHNEPIDSIRVHVSHGHMRTTYPFRAQAPAQKDQKDPIPLDGEEMMQVEQACGYIQDPTLTDAFRKAMISDLEWKKGNR